MPVMLIFSAEAEEAPEHWGQVPPPPPQKKNNFFYAYCQIMHACGIAKVARCKRKMEVSNLYSVLPYI